jgi:MerR family copper efflux transcriptional regulator
VKSLAQQHLDFLDKKLEEILSMKTALAHLISCCHGDERPDCPILEGLAGAKGKV